MTRLATVRISRASAAQRAGRAGRLAPGHCYRLWPESTVLEAFAQPEILQADLAPLALQLLAFGVNHPGELQWLTPPPAAAYQQALNLLEGLGAVTLDPIPRLTAHGQAMAEFPAHPRLAHMMLLGAQAGLTKEACLLSSLLTEPNRPRGAGADLEPLLAELSSARQSRDPWRDRVLRQAKTFEQTLEGGRTGPALPAEQAPGFLIAHAYPDRVAQRRTGEAGLYRLSQGRSARVHKSDPLAQSEWLAVADLGGVTEQSEDQIYSACTFDPALFSTHLAAAVTEREVAHWDASKNRFVAERHTLYGELLLKREHLPNLAPERRQKAITAYIEKAGLTCLNWAEDARQWRARVQLLRDTPACDLGESGAWPDVSDQALLKHLSDWLEPALAKVHTLADLQKIPLRPLLETLLPWPLAQKLNEWAPARMAAPSGSEVALDYEQRPPVMAVKLQEMFGLKETPCVARGQVAVRIHLLSPGGQPLQITQDLAHFWQHGYPQVQKEMKGRYPRHPWPDDPLAAEPTRMTKKQLARTQKT